MAWVFVIGVKSPDGSMEQREFMVHDARLATLLKRIFFDKNCSKEEMEQFAAEVATDPELAREWQEISPYITVPTSH